MISATQLANLFENDLNDILKAKLGNSEIQFKIWANAGEYQRPVREGNTIVHNIIGNLRTSTSANDANNVLAMGVNGISLEFLVPVLPPKTNAAQTAEYLAKIKDSQYPFLELISNVINSYFQTAQSTFIKDESGTEYSVAFQAGTVLPGSVELAVKLGQALPISVFVQVYFIEGGINSKDVKVSVDGQLMPFQAVRLGRASIVERDVYSGSVISKCLVSSTAFSIDADFPSSNNNPASKTAIDYVLNGEPNTAHFVNVEWGSKVQKLFFMSYNTIQSSATGIAIAGLSASLMEIVSNTYLYNVPRGFQIARFKFTNSINSNGSAVTLSFNLSAEVNAYISGVGAAKMSGNQTVTLTDASFTYDEEEDAYFVDLVTETAVTITNASTQFSIIPEA